MQKIIRKNRSKTIDKYVDTSYNIYIIKQNKAQNTWLRVWFNIMKGESQSGKRKKEFQRDRKRTARTETLENPVLRKPDRNRNYHNYSASGTDYGNLKLD